MNVFLRSNLSKGFSGGDPSSLRAYCGGVRVGSKVRTSSPGGTYTVSENTESK